MLFEWEFFFTVQQKKGLPRETATHYYIYARARHWAPGGGVGEQREKDDARKKNKAEKRVSGPGFHTI